MTTPPPPPPPPSTSEQEPASSGAAKTAPKPSRWGAWMRVRPWLQYNVVAPPLVLALVLALSYTHLFIAFEAQTLDARYQFRSGQDPEFDARLILGEIDEITLDRLGSWPINRKFYGELLEYLTVEPPRVVALDLILDRPSDSPESDAILVKAAESYFGFITAASSDKQTIVAGKSHIDANPKEQDFGQTQPILNIKGDKNQIDGSQLSILPFPMLRAASSFGFANAEPAVSDPVRRVIPMVTRADKYILPSLVLRMLCIYWDVPVENIEVDLGNEIRLKSAESGEIHRIPVNAKGELYINYRFQRDGESGSVKGPLIELYRLAYSKFVGKDLFPEMYKERKLRKVRDSILLIGLTAVGTSDIGVNPFSNREPLVYVHLNALNTILRNDYSRTAPLWVQCTVWLLLSGAVLYLLDRCRLRVAITVPFLIIGSYLVLCLVVFTSHSLILPMVWPVLGFSAVCVGSAYLRWQAEQLEKQRISKIFSSYVSPGIMDEVMKDPEKVKLGGASKRVSIMFSDIRGFTTISEAMGDEALVIQLNEYFDKMVGCVIKHDGTLHKFIGDAIMAVWGDVVSKSEEEDAQNAVRCALEMRKALVELNVFWTKTGRMTQAFGIGINHGMVRVGNIGAPTRMEFTVIGDPVNFASRLEGVTKEFRTDLLIGESVKPLLGDGFLLRTAGKILVKGKTEAITVYEVICEVKDPVYTVQKQWVDRYETAFAAYQQKNFAAALTDFEWCLTQPGREKDFCCQQYAEACRDFIAEPPVNWTGVYVMKTK